MCGLVATFGPAPAELADVELACRAIAHRGPDGQGIWTGRAGRLAADLGHRRLAILDPSPAGAQPMTIDGDSLAVSYNGELYNYPQLSTQLQSRGHRFCSRWDAAPLATAAVLTLLWVPHPRSSFLGVEKVAPGHRVVPQDGQVRVERYWDLVAAWSQQRAAGPPA